MGSAALFRRFGARGLTPLSFFGGKRKAPEFIPKETGTEKGPETRKREKESGGKAPHSKAHD
jgi:hypothetical protein